jgi:hypothetical protein
VGDRRWFASVRYGVWGRTLTTATATAAVLALAAPMAVAQGLGTGPFHFTGTLWHPKALPATPGVGGHPLTGTAKNTHAPGTKAMTPYKVTIPAWPAAGSATVALTTAASSTPTSSDSAKASASPSATAAALHSALAAHATPQAPVAGAKSTATRSSASPTGGGISTPTPASVVPVSGPVKAGTLPVWVQARAGQEEQR